MKMLLKIEAVRKKLMVRMTAPRSARALTSHQDNPEAGLQVPAPQAGCGYTVKESPRQRLVPHLGARQVRVDKLLLSRSMPVTVRDRIGARKRCSRFLRDWQDDLHAKKRGASAGPSLRLE